MPKSDLYISPGKDEAAKLARSTALLARSMAESEDMADRLSSRAYHLSSEMWRAISEGTQTPAGAIALLRAAAQQGDVDAGAIDGVIDQMENIFLKGYRDTIASVPVAAPKPPAPANALPEPARAMSLAEIYKLRSEMGQPAAPEPMPSDEDLERSARQIAVVGQAFRGQVAMPRRGGPRR
jgi:hypothetical protein